MPRRALICLLFVLACCLSADTVVLKDGRTLSGRVLEKDGEHLALQVTFGTLYIPLEDIAEILAEPSLLDIFEESRAACETVEDFEALLAWCEETGYPSYDARRALKAARIARIRRQHPDDWCLTCGGAQLVACEACEADGHIEHRCEDCTGEGAVPCPECLEHPGTFICVPCEGSGSAAKDCRPCRTTGLVRCDACKGDKRRRCSTCRGAGVVEDLVETYVYLNGQLVPAKRVVYVECGTCDGRRDVTCRRCNAEGQATCGRCSGHGSVPERCSDCRGRPVRRCPTCRGKAEADCAVCKGHGEIPEDCPECDDGSHGCLSCDGQGWGRDNAPGEQP